jgi:plastocyanin
LLAAGVSAGLAAGVAVSHQTVNASTQAAAVPAKWVNLVIVPDSLTGPDKKTHDAYIPAYLAAQVGQKVTVTVYNLDTASHSFTSPALKINEIIPAAKANGLEGSLTFTFTASKAGVYHWKCILPCDNGGVNAWAMTHDGYMAGTITIK